MQTSAARLATDAPSASGTRAMWPRLRSNPFEQERVARLAMVSSQIERRGIHDQRLLQAMRDVPRHSFVTAAGPDEAYGDHPLPIPEEQTISQPYMVALMIQCLRLRGAERVLDVGTGSGYQAAVLGRMAARGMLSPTCPQCTPRHPTAGLPKCSRGAGERMPRVPRTGALPGDHRRRGGSVRSRLAAGAVGRRRAARDSHRRHEGATAHHRDPKRGRLH